MANSETITDQQQTYSCFLSAPYEVSRGALPRELERQGVRPIIPYELPASDRTLLDKVTQEIAQADFFVAILVQDRPNDETLFELGYAYALRKRILVLAPPDFRDMPASLSVFPVFQIDIHDSEAVYFAVQVLLSSPKPPSSLKSRGRRQRPSFRTHPVDRHLIQELMQRLSNPSPVEIEDVVATAMQASGINVIVRSESGRPNTKVDLAIWSDDLEASVGNPLVIEIKSELQSRRHLEDVRSQVLGYLSRTHARSGLVLYLHGPDGMLDLWTMSLPNVFFMSIKEFLEGLTTDGFGELVRKLRNQVVHPVTRNAVYR